MPNYINYKPLYESEKLRADLLMEELDEVDLMHYEETAQLRTEIALLKQKLRMKEVN